MYDNPGVTPEVGWLACFNNCLLFALFDTTHDISARRVELSKRLIENNWLALRNINFFLTPRLVNVQALLMSVGKAAAFELILGVLPPPHRARKSPGLITAMVQVVVAQETSRPSPCWTLLCQACRLAQALGLHRRSDPSQFQDEDEREEQKWVFWNLYIMDKTVSMAFGRMVCMPDFDIDVDPPKETGDLLAHDDGLDLARQDPEPYL